MKRFLILAALLCAAPALAADHNNLDAGRPLRFDDATPIAFREQSLEVGFGLSVPRRRPLGLGLDAEYLYGAALNTQLGLGFSPSAGGRADASGTAFDLGDVSLSALHSFNREVGNTPALAVRGDVLLPSGRGSRGPAFRLRGILSKSVRPYDRLHLNLDLNLAPYAPRGEREIDPGLVLGYSRPLGYPHHFATTGLAELALQAGPRAGAGPVLSAGIGVRRQVGVRSVLDAGLQSDLAGFGGAPRDRVRLVAGYSFSF
jgi:hypothetical protein